MATIKDIAQLAGVSQGTVSNIINGKGNVSMGKIRLVEAAMKELNYSINAQAQQLRASRKATPNIAVVLPNILEDRYAALYTCINRYLGENGYCVQLFLTGEIPYTEEEIVGTISSLRPAGVISVTCHPTALELYYPIVSNGGKLVFVEREPLNEERKYSYSYVGFDYFAAGTEIAEDILKRNYKRVGLFSNFEHFSHEASFTKGLTQKLNDYRSGISLEIHRSNLATANRVACNFFIGEDSPDAIVTTSSLLRTSIEYALSITVPPKTPASYTLYTKSSLTAVETYQSFYMDYYDLGKRACSVLLGNITGDIPDSRRDILLAAGFPKARKIPRKVSKTTLNVLLIRGQTAKALRSMTPRFSEKSNIEINYVVLSPQEVIDNLLHIRDNVFFDVMRSNFSLIPCMPVSALLPIDPLVYQETTAGMLDRVVETLSLSRGEEFAVPLDVSTQLLVYRKDLFDNPVIKRQYLEITGKALSVPEDFDKMIQVAKFFTRQYTPSSPVQYGCSVDMGTDTMLFTSFLHRYRSQAGCLFLESDGRIKCSPPKILAAFRNYKGILPYANVTADSYWDTDIMHFINGLTAMESISINYATNIQEIQKSKVDGRIGYAAIPGNCPGLGGGSLVVPRVCRDYSAAMEYIHWACGGEQAELFTYLGGTSPHERPYANGDILNLYPWYSCFIDTINNCSRNEDWNAFDRFQVESLFGYVLRNIFRDVLTCEEGVDIVMANLPDCRFK